MRYMFQQNRSKKGLKNVKITKAIQKVENEVWNLDFLNNTALLDKEKVNNLAEIKDDLLASFKKRQMFRPRYLMEVSVLKDMKFPTPDAKYWQCLLERDIMLQNLMSLGLDFKEKIADIKIKEAEIDELSNNHNAKSRANIEKIKIQIKRDLFQMTMMRKEAEERYREIMAWTDIITELRPKLKYSEDNAEEHMPESFLIRFAQQKQVKHGLR